MATHACGVCRSGFPTEEAYLAHVCSVTNHTPEDPVHFGSRFVLQSKKALERGGSLDEEKAAEIDAKLQTIKDEDIDDKLMRAAQAPE